MSGKKSTKKQKRVIAAIKYIQHYMNTYDKQLGYADYTDETIINDVLYGLGVALNPEAYQYALGFENFKDKLRKFLKEAK